MASVQSSEAMVRLRAENVGGIDATEVEFRPGVNLLTGWNASNRTSLLQAVKAVLGSDQASLKADADEGLVELELEGETYRRTLTRREDGVAFDGTPYTDDPELADLFAFLLESNEARQAVARGDDLREIIMRPVDTAAVRDEIEALEARKREVEAELEERDRLADEAESLETERAGLETEIDEQREAIAAKREEIEAADAELEESRDRKAELESELSALQERRSTLEDVRYRLETERETAEGIREELADVEAALEGHDEAPVEELERLEERTSALHERKRVLDARTNQLQALVQFNEELLEGPEIETLDALDAGDGGADDVTAGLLPEAEAFVCWTCGAEATRADIEEQLERLRDRRSALVEERRETTAELEAVTDREAALEERREELATLESSRESLREDLADAEAEVKSLRERRAELVDEVEARQEAVEELREAAYDDIVDLHTAANELELELERLEAERERTDERLQAIDERLAELEALEAEREELQTALEEARTRIERLEDEAVEAFNDQMATVLDVLDYDNVERIWLERVERSVREGRGTDRRGFFELHVVRSTESGTVYEDTVAHLSESEREVTGLVFALAGYLVHDVHEAVPFMLLDSIEAIDATRIAALVGYLEGYADYLVVALLPEDAKGVDDAYHRITEI